MNRGANAAGNSNRHAPQRPTNPNTAKTRARTPPRRKKKHRGRRKYTAKTLTGELGQRRRSRDLSGREVLLWGDWRSLGKRAGRQQGNFSYD
ncbi:hypothetical protein Tco_1329497 [Tanacetum coccineum]